MTIQILQPTIEDATREYVLVQAWKKTAGHIRNHNWYSDTLLMAVETRVILAAAALCPEGGRRSLAE